MSKLEFALSAWNLHLNPLAHTGKSERLCQQGWFGMTINHPSPFEWRAIRAFVGKFGSDAWLSRLGKHDDTYKFADGGHADYEYSEASAWFRREEDRTATYAMIEGLPKRETEFLVPQLSQEQLMLLDGVNHMLISFRYQDELILSAEIKASVAQLRLMLP